jgi:hypothetical protein
MHPSKGLAFAAVLCAGMACSLIVDLELEVECFCGERWTSQISGAKAFHFNGTTYTIPASKTTYEACVTQLEHLALDTADPQDPLYVALRDSFESGAIANCEAAGAKIVELYFIGTNCATTGTDPVTTNLSYAGTCWEVEKYDIDEEELCPLDSVCGSYYDCSSEPIVGIGDDEAGDEIAWECDDPM